MLLSCVRLFFICCYNCVSFFHLVVFGFLFLLEPGGGDGRPRSRAVVWRCLCEVVLFCEDKTRDSPQRGAVHRTTLLRIPQQAVSFFSWPNFSIFFSPLCRKYFSLSPYLCELLSQYCSVRVQSRFRYISSSKLPSIMKPRYFFSNWTCQPYFIFFVLFVEKTGSFPVCSNSVFYPFISKQCLVRKASKNTYLLSSENHFQSFFSWQNVSSFSSCSPTRVGHYCPHAHSAKYSNKGNKALVLSCPLRPPFEVAQCLFCHYFFVAHSVLSNRTSALVRLLIAALFQVHVPRRVWKLFCQ